MGTDDRRSLRAAIATLVAAAVLLLGAGAVTLLVVAGGTTADRSAASTHAPGLSLRALEPAIGDRYREAVAYRSVFEQLACHCGCMRTLHHRNLYDCFMLRDGGYNPHGRTCPVCLGEAKDAARMAAAGESVAAIRVQIDRTYGGATGCSLDGLTPCQAPS